MLKRGKLRDLRQQHTILPHNLSQKKNTCLFPSADAVAAHTVKPSIICNNGCILYHVVCHALDMAHVYTVTECIPTTNTHL